MGVVQDTTRKIKVGAIVAILLIGGLWAYTKQDTSNDRQATVLVVLGPTERRANASVFTYINDFERGSGYVDKENPNFSETFWVRPGEKVRVKAGLYLGSTTITCTIMFDGVPAAGPKVTPAAFEASCEIWARA